MGWGRKYEEPKTFREKYNEFASWLVVGVFGVSFLVGIGKGIKKIFPQEIKAPVEEVNKKVLDTLKPIPYRMIDTIQRKTDSVLEK